MYRLKLAWLWPTASLYALARKTALMTPTIRQRIVVARITLSVTTPNSIFVAGLPFSENVLMCGMASTRYAVHYKGEYTKRRERQERARPGRAILTTRCQAGENAS